MKLKDFDKLKKFMQKTMSGTDAERLQAIDFANRVLNEYNLDWDRVFRKLVTVVAEVEESPEDLSAGAIDPEAKEIDEAFNALEESGLHGSFAATVDSIRGQWTTKRFLTDAQKGVIFRARDRIKNG